MALPAEKTLLILEGIGVPLYSARGLSQNYGPIAEADQSERGTDGEDIDFSEPQFKKYRTTITGRDQRPPAVDGIWPGTLVTVSCISRLTYPADGTPGRGVVDGSEIAEGDFISYLPILECTVKDFSVDEDEYSAQVSWTLTLEEK